MNSELPTRWGIISAGLISNDFCLAIQALPAEKHQIVAVAARNLQNAKDFAEKFKIPKSYGSYDEIASDPDIDIIYIGTIHPYHCNLSKMMLLSGKAVLCEKPMGMSSAEALEVISVAQEKKILFVEGFWSRFFPAYIQLRKELATNSIGEIKLLTVEFGAKFDWEKQDRIAKKELGGGVVLDIGCYAIQLANLVFNLEMPEKIVANGVLHEISGVDKQVSVFLCYKGGRIAHILLSGECQLSNSAVLYGTEGKIEIPTTFWCPLELKTPKMTYQYQVPHTAEKTHFRNSAGFVFEIEGVRETLLQGRTQAAEMTHDDSLLVARIQDEILRQLGVLYK